jgi:hypothetical protein
MHRIGLAPLTALELAPPDFVTCAAEAGFDFVGLRLIPATAEEKQHAMVGDTALVRETARRVANAGIPVLDVEIFRRPSRPRSALVRAKRWSPATIRTRHASSIASDSSAISRASTGSTRISSRCPGPT